MPLRSLLSLAVAPDDPPRRRRDLLLTLPFLVLFYVQLAHHAMWRDELNAFGIAASSPNLATLFHTIHYEGHPWLWYALLWLSSKVSPFPVAMQAIEALIGTGIFFLIGLRSPFSAFGKILLMLSYFVTFEYTVLSRMYGLLLLLLLVYLDRRSQPVDHPVVNGVLLGLMCSTDTMGILLAAALALEYAWGLLERRRLRALLGAGFALAGLLAFSLWTLKLAPDISRRTTDMPFQHTHDLRYLLRVALRTVALPYLPVTTLRLDRFWHMEGSEPFALVLLVFVLALGTYWWTFRRHPKLLAMVFSLVLALVLFGHLIYFGSKRHFGTTFLIFVAGLWLLAVRERRLPRLPVLLLVLCALGGVLANVEEWRRPFSNAGNTAAWLRANGLAAAPIAGSPDVTVAELAELMHRPVYQLDCNCVDTFLLFSRRRDSFTREQTAARLLLARQRLGPALVYIDSLPLEADQVEQLRAAGVEPRLLRSFTGSELQEDFYVYRLDGRGGPLHEGA